MPLTSHSPTFYKQLLYQYYFTQKLRSQTVIREKLHIKLSYEKAALKMLVKFTPVVNFVNNLQEAFAQILLWQKITKAKM
jgi:hypothetical protein